MAIADKLQSILDSKAAIKAAIEEKGVENVGDVLADYPSKIASIQSGGSGWTGHADVEGLKAIGWTDEDIEYYQQHGINWNEEDDEYHKVPQDNIDLYGVINADNIQDYANILVYLPKIDTSSVTSMNGMFASCFSLVSIPQLDTSSVTSMNGMFASCFSLVSIPQLDTSSVTSMDSMFVWCVSLISIPQLDTSSVTSMNAMFRECNSLISIPQLDTSSVIDMASMFRVSRSLVFIPQLNVSSVTNMNSMLNDCNSLKNVLLQKIKTSLQLNSSHLLSKESLLYIINNEVSESPITITLSAYCYNKYNADEDVTAALAAHPNVSLASA